MKTLFVKLGALGGVLRATPFFTGLKEKYPEIELHVLTKANALDLLKDNNNIDKIWVWENDKDVLKKTDFDWVINTEDDKETCTFVAELKTKKFSGPYFSGEKISYTDDVALWYDTGKISRHGLQKANELKKKSTKSYQQVYSEIFGFPEDKNYRLRLDLTEEEMKSSEDFRKKNGILDSDILIGINTGAGENWPLKALSTTKTALLIEDLSKHGFKLVLMGGPNEKERNKEILKLTKANVIDSGTENSMREFISIVNALDMIVTSDTLALHLAAALDKRIVSFFGPTSAEEIELYGNGVKIKPNSDCYSCFQKTKNKEVMCIDEIKVEDLVHASLNEAKYLKN